MLFRLEFLSNNLSGICGQFSLFGLYTNLKLKKKYFMYNHLISILSLPQHYFFSSWLERSAMLHSNSFFLHVFYGLKHSFMDLALQSFTFIIQKFSEKLNHSLQLNYHQWSFWWMLLQGYPTVVVHINGSHFEWRGMPSEIEKALTTNFYDPNQHFLPYHHPKGVSG